MLALNGWFAEYSDNIKSRILFFNDNNSFVTDRVINMWLEDNHEEAIKLKVKRVFHEKDEQV